MDFYVIHIRKALFTCTEILGEIFSEIFYFAPVKIMKQKYSRNIARNSSQKYYISFNISLTNVTQMFQTISQLVLDFQLFACIHIFGCYTKVYHIVAFVTFWLFTYKFQTVIIEDSLFYQSLFDCSYTNFRLLLSKFPYFINHCSTVHIQTFGCYYNIEEYF